MDAVGGVGGGLMGDRRGVGGIVDSVEMGKDIVTGGTGYSRGTGGPADSVAAGCRVGQESGAGGVDVRTNSRGVGTDTSGGGKSDVITGGLVSKSTGFGTGGIGTGGLDSGSTGLSTGVGGAGTSGFDSGSSSGIEGPGAGAGGLAFGSTGTGNEGVGVGSLGFETTGPGIGIGGVSTGEMTGGGVGSLGSTSPGSSNGIGGGVAGDVGTGPGVLGVGPKGLNSVVGGVGLSSGRLSESSVGGVALGAGDDTTGGMGGMGSEFRAGNGDLGGGTGNGVGGGLGGNGRKVQGQGPTVMEGGIRGSPESERKGGDDIGVAQSVCGGMSRISIGNSDISGAQVGYGSDGYDSITGAYAEQAVELTERRTVLIR